MSSGGAPTPAGTSVFTKHNWDMGMGYLWLNGWGIYHLMGGAFMAYWVGHLWLNGWGICHLMEGHLSLNGWGTYGLNGWGSYDKVSCCFVWKYAQKLLVFRGVPFPIIA